MESTAITTRDLKAETEARSWGVSLVLRGRGGGNYRTVHHWLSAAARGGNARMIPNRLLKNSFCVN